MKSGIKTTIMVAKGNCLRPDAAEQTSGEEQFMNAYSRCIIAMILVVLVLALAPGAIRAEVTRVEISSRQDVLGGKSFGTVGSYEKLSGKVYFAVDPNNSHNKIIADLDKAPRNAQGKVEFSADIFIVRPKDPSHGNSSLIF